jgi:hypothetical protein
METATGALLLVNRASGTQAAIALTGTLAAVLERRLPATVAEVADHPAAAAVARRFVAATPRALVVVAGGGGTLRAAVEGSWAALGGRPVPAERLTVAALRLGSGNLVARALGAGRDPVESLRRLLAAHAAGGSVPVPLIRCREAGRELLGLGLAGFGQWGRVPGDIARWRRLAGPVRRRLGRLAGIERLNGLEYRACFARRLAEAALAPGRLDLVAIQAAGGPATHVRLLAAGALNLPVSGLPGPRPPDLTEPAFDLHVLPWPARRRPRLRWRLTAGGEPVRIRLLGAGRAEWFLDEDPEVFSDLLLDLPGAVHFVRGGSPR